MAATLGAFRRNPVAMRDGEWINPGDEYGGVEFRTRALGPAYADARAAKIRRAARLAGGEQKIGQADMARINIDALVEHCLLDVRGLTHDPLPDGTPGKPVTFAELKALIVLEEHSDLALVAFNCAQVVGQNLGQQAQDTEGN